MTAQFEERLARIDHGDHLCLMYEDGAEALGIRSWLIAPMLGGGGVVGALTVFTTESGRRYGDAEVALAQDLAARGSSRRWSTRSWRLIETDPAKLRHIIANLLSDAVKYPEEGRVRLTAYSREDAVVFRVEDTGIGIAPEQGQRVSEPFWQADTSRTRRAEGTGLGLAVAARFTEMPGGELAVESVVGEGSTFTLRLPIAGAAAELRITRGRRGTSCRTCGTTSDTGERAWGACARRRAGTRGR